jgi:glycosyltransferase involved in cell wall biosynthesis
MKSLTILQNEIPAYRKPVYNGLAKSYRVTVLHCGRKSVSETDFYKEIILPRRTLGPVYTHSMSRIHDIIRTSDAVIAMFDLRWPCYLIPLLYRSRPKYILWGHWYSTSQIANSIRDWLMRRADRLLMYGGEEVERMVSRGIDRDRIVIAPNTVDVPGSTDTSFQAKNSFLFVGRLEAAARRNSKRADLLITSFAKLQGQIEDDIGLDIVGDGDERQFLARLAEGLGIGTKVRFHGHVDDPHVLSTLFGKAFALVSPGHVGLSVLQAFGHGVPIVTGKAVPRGAETQHLFNVATGAPVIMGPEYYNLRHATNSWLYETDAELLSVLARLCNEPRFAAELGQNAFRHYATERTLDHMLDGFRRAIEE